MSVPSAEGKVELLNYQHLFYFYTVVREGGVTQAARALQLAPPTISAQLRTLQRDLRVTLFEKQGRKLALTEAGELAYRYAREAFSLGGEMVAALKDATTPSHRRVVVGIHDAVPALVVKRVLRPLLADSTAPALVCRAEGIEGLLVGLEEREIDLIVSDAPLPMGTRFTAHSHSLGSCAVTFLAVRKLARRYGRTFPESLSGAPLVLPGRSRYIRAELERWFATHGLAPAIKAESNCDALLNALAREGVGAIPVPRNIEVELRQLYDLAVLGRVDDVCENYFVISREQKSVNPSVALVLESAGVLENGKALRYRSSNHVGRA